ncbi:MAG: arsenic resistance protein [Pseudomonadota bacterium]
MLSKSFSLQNAEQFISGWGSVVVILGAILIGSMVGIASDGVGDRLSNFIDYTILGLVFLLLFEVRPKKILSSLHRIDFIIAALVANFIIIPVLGFGIASVFLSSHPLFFIGLLIYFMAPCTDWFLGFTRLAHGNTTLGASLLPINMILQLLLYPFYLHIFGVEIIETDAVGIFQTLWQWFLIPLLGALASRYILERFLQKEVFETIEALISIIIPLCVALLVGQIFAANIGTLSENISIIPIILLAIFVFFTLTYTLSEVITKIMKFNYEDRALLTMTTGARNAPLMLAVTTAVLPDQPIIYAAIIIGTLIEFPHLIALKIILKKSNVKQQILT